MVSYHYYFLIDKTAMNYIIANWKANKTFDEAQEWMAMFTTLLKNEPDIQAKLDQDKLSIIICPPAPFIFSLANAVAEMKNVTIGAQHISPFEEGAHTGEVTIKSVLYGAGCTLVGHSERREYFKESEEDIANEVMLAAKYKVEPILCIRGETDKIHQGAKFIAYEPVEAIGTGHNMNAEEVVAKKKIFALPADGIFIYGGSVNEKTCAEYLQHQEINGLLVGSASLIPETFTAILKAA